MKKYFIAMALAASSCQLALAQEEPPEYYIFSIYFGGGSYYIDEEQVQELYHWLDGIPDIETHQISIHGHTDDIGSREYNKWLSQLRNDSALQQLLNKGIPRELIDVVDFGKDSPVFDNRTWEGKLRNRRVDVIIKPLVM
ncbi:MAG TPA: OmpA family protein [Saprospiraceae bacterium]|nr:OmpA family protein [Saprospiraceae bacterium]HMP23554.1 OmpA family protein [Saprospiraceae bacterium]